MNPPLRTPLGTRPLRSTIRSLFRSSLLAAALAAALPSSAFAQDSAPSAPPPELPPGVVARVFGTDVTESQLFDRLARRYETSEKGRQILEQIVDDELVAVEARRRGVTVTDEEARAYADRMAEVVRVQSGGQKSLGDVLQDTGTTREEFLRTTREYLVREKMAREDLGTKAGEDLPEHRMKLWTASLRRRMSVRYEGLPEGVLASLGDPAAGGTVIDRRRFAKELSSRLPPELVASIRMELVLDLATRHEVEQAGITVSEDEVAAQVKRLRERFESNPRVKGTVVTFDQFLRQQFGMGEAELQQDATFRARVGLEHMLLRDISDADVKKYWDDNREAYGDRVLVRQVYVAAADKGSELGSGMPTFREAGDLALRAKVEILERTGMLPGVGAPKTPLADVVTAVAKQFEANTESRATAGEPVAWTRLNVANEPELEKAVFDGAIGALVGPIRSNVGYHVVYVEERRPAPPYDEVQTQIRDDLLRVAVRRFQLRIRSDPAIILPR